MPAGPGLCPDRPGLFPGQWVFTQRMHSSVTRRKCIFVTIGKRGKPRFCGAGMAPRVPLALAANKSESEPSPQVPRNALGRLYRTVRRFKLKLRRKLRNSNRTEISENPKSGVPCAARSPFRFDFELEIASRRRQEVLAFLKEVPFFF